MNKNEKVIAGIRVKNAGGQAQNFKNVGNAISNTNVILLIETNVWDNLSKFMIKYPGLCKKHQLIYGVPSQPKTNSHTLPALFNFNSLIVDYCNSTQVNNVSMDMNVRICELQNSKDSIGTVLLV